MVTDAPGRSTWARRGSVFGGVILATVGILQFLQGLSAVLNDKVYAATPSYVFELDLTLWGWVHLVLGAVAVPVGVAVVAGKPWAFYFGILFAVLSIIAQFVFLPYYPLWALTILAIDALVIWALSVRLREDWTLI